MIIISPLLRVLRLSGVSISALAPYLKFKIDSEKLAQQLPAITVERINHAAWLTNERRPYKEHLTVEITHGSAGETILYQLDPFLYQNHHGYSD